MQLRLLQVSLVASMLVVCLARADEPSPTGGPDEPTHDQPSLAAGSGEKKTSLPAKKLSARRAKGEKPGKQAKKAPVQVEAAPSTEVEREEAALVFVRKYQPDLVELLERLKATKAQDYQRAVSELARESNRLAALRDRDIDRYKLELHVWQINSRIRLLTAKLSLEDREELREDVKAALAEQAEVRMALKALERERLTARLKKIEADIAHLASQGKADLNRKFERLMRAAERSRGRAKPAVAKPAVESTRPALNPVETKPLKKN
jgi:hypothetical protein